MKFLKPKNWIIVVAGIISLVVIAVCTANPTIGSSQIGEKQIIVNSPTEFNELSKDFEKAFDFGKAFLNDYYLQKAGKGKIDFSKYIKNENLLKYSDLRMTIEDYTLDIEFCQKTVSK